MAPSQRNIFLGKEEGMRFIFKQICIIFGVLFISSGISVAADKLPVFVSIVPQKYFVQQIGKDFVEIQAMVRPGANPAT